MAGGLKALLTTHTRTKVRGEKSIGELEEQVAKQQTVLEKLQPAANAAFLESAESPGNAASRKRADDARAEIVAAQNRLAELSGALASARQRQEHLDVAADEAAKADSWATVERIAGERVTLAVQIETAILNLHGLRAELLQAGSDMFQAAPVRTGKIHHGPLALEQIEHDFRLQMFKNGFDFASAWPYGKTEIPTFSARVKQGNRAILEHKR